VRLEGARKEILMNRNESFSTSSATTPPTPTVNVNNEYEIRKGLRVGLCASVILAYGIRPDATTIAVREARQLLALVSVLGVALGHATDETVRDVRRALARQFRKLFWEAECRLSDLVGDLPGFKGADVDLCCNRSRELLETLVAAAMSESFHHYVHSVACGATAAYAVRTAREGLWAIEAAAKKAGLSS
jgi:hypothetical protein